MTMLRKIQELTCIILARYLAELYAEYRLEVKSFFETLSRLEAERGLPFVVKYVKSSRLAITRYISGQPLASMEGVALADGWPVWLIPFKRLTTSTPGIRLLMTLLVSLRGIRLEPKLDISPIIAPWKGSDTITDRELNHACRRLRIRPVKAEWSKFHMSTKSGPLGQALLMSVTELTNLPQELLDDIILVGGRSLGKVIGNLKMPRWAEHSIVSIWATMFKPKTASFRKISFFSDKEGKTRVIAILDYWSQSSLRPLHSAINGVLRGVKMDCTYDQGSFKANLPPLGPYHSLDLSNATDRMPIALQQRVIEKFIGKERAAAWARILVKYQYNLKGMSAISYNCGQPMGAYSSWPAMAITHHVIVHVAALRAGKPHFTKYVLLGDDIVIADDAVAEQYRLLLSQLDMPISEQKTHVSKDTCEFAKRWIHKGEEVTGFSIGGLFSVWKRYSLFHNYLSTQRDHGWILELDGHPGLIAHIYGLFGRSQQAERVSKLYMLFDAVAEAKDTGDHSRIVLVLEEFFGIPASQHEPLLSGALSKDAYGRKLRLEAAKRLCERDFGRFQKDAYSVSARLSGQFSRNFPGLSVPDYRAALRGNHPLVTVLNGMILESAHVLMDKFGKSVGITTARSSQYQAIQASPKETAVLEDSYLSVGLSKYFVSKGVFTMRASHAISLADSQVCKLILDVSRAVQAGKLDLSEPVADLPRDADAPREVQRVYRTPVIPTGPTIYLMSP